MPPKLKNPLDPTDLLFDSWNIIYQFLQDELAVVAGGRFPERDQEGIQEEIQEEKPLGIEMEDIESVIESIREFMFDNGLDDNSMSSMSSFLFSDVGEQDRPVSPRAAHQFTFPNIDKSLRTVIRKKVRDELLPDIQARTDIDKAWELLFSKAEEFLQPA